MNKRQAKKRKQFNKLIIESHYLAHSWSEFRWYKSWHRINALKIIDKHKEERNRG